MGIDKKALNKLIGLITKVLGNCLFDVFFNVRAFAFYDRKGNAIYKKDDIRTAMRPSIRLHHVKLCRNMKNVFADIVPINKLEIKAFGISKDCLLKALAQRQQIIDLFIRSDKPVVRDIFKRIDCVRNIVI